MAGHVLFVSNFQSLGYKCRRNVGASAYKVDIAVEKPGFADIMMAGIECDGAHYIDTRTAHDRDVLRPGMMASLGWRMYHVWSMGWYLNPEDEKKRLAGFLKQCEKTDITSQVPREKQSNGHFDEEAIISAGSIEEMTNAEDNTTDTHTLSFDQYEYADPWQAPYQYGDDNYTNLSKRIMWVVEREQPIHKEELYRRLATVFGNVKATAPVRRTIDDCIKRRMPHNLAIRGDFIYLEGAPIKARAPKPYDEPRSIEHIAPEELQDAMIRILQFAYGLAPKDLISETARQLGYARTGPKINAILEENIRALLGSGKARESDDRLYCTEVNG